MLWCPLVCKVDQTKARTMHKSAKVARFCSQRHLDMTKGKPWAAVMLLISVATGERVDAVRQICTDWITGLQPEEVGKPTITWPQVNLKTTARCCVLDVGVATLLWQWMSKTPLCSDKNNSQWPWPGQELQRDLRERTSSYLFPGQIHGGKHERNPHRKRKRSSRHRSTTNAALAELTASRTSTSDGFRPSAAKSRV